MLILPFTIATILLFIYTWAALNKPRQYPGTPNERLHFTWHAIQFAMIALFLICGRMAAGGSFNHALKIFANPTLFWAIIIAGLIYVLLSRFWPQWFPSVPEWFIVKSGKNRRTVDSQ